LCPPRRRGRGQAAAPGGPRPRRVPTPRLPHSGPSGMYRPRSPRSAPASSGRWCVRYPAARAVSKTTLQHRPVRGAMKYAGLWYITTMELWDEDYLNMEVQAFIRITREGGGEFQFGLVSGQLDGE